MTEEIKIREGACPVCGSEHVTYGILEVCDEGVYYEVFCEDCNSNFEEHYDLTFAGHVVGTEFKHV